MAVSGQSDAEHLVPTEFDELIIDSGTPANWWQSRMCPCSDPITGQPDQNCAYCFAYPGTLWSDPRPVRVYAPARRRFDLIDDTGHIMQGMVTLTFTSDITPAHLDRIELTAAVMWVNREVHVRDDVDPAGRSRERLRFTTVLAVDTVEAIVAGVLTPYAQNVDFTLGADNAVTWITGPPSQTLYTVRYTARPVYVCWSPESRDEGGTKQPYRCPAQRLDFYRQPVVGL